MEILTKIRKWRSLLISCVVITGFSSLVQAQEIHQAPTLQLGLNGLSFTKGNLDAQLIMDIIAEKQEEIKLKLVQNMLLGRLEDTGATPYVFVDNVVKNVLREKDTELRTRKIIESAVNLSLSAALTKFIFSNGDTQTQNDITLLAQAFKINVTGWNGRSISALVKGSTINRYYEDRNALPLLVLMLDMSSELIRTNIKLKQLGLFNVNYEGSYFNLNKYLKLKLYNSAVNGTIAPTPAILENSDDLDSYKFLVSRRLFDHLNTVINRLAERIGLIQFIVQSRELPIDRNNIANFTLASFQGTWRPVLGSQPGDYLLNSVPNSLELWIRETRLQLQSVNWAALRAANPQAELTKVFDEMNNHLMFIKKLDATIIDEANVKASYAEILFYLSNSLLTDIKSISHLDPAIAKSVLTLSRTNQYLMGCLLHNLTDKAWLNDLETSVFLQLLSKCYQFNELSTYSEYLNFLSEVADLLPSDRVRATISTVNSFIHEFTSIKVDEGTKKEIIEFNVESFLTKIKDIKYDRWSPFEFHFTVGVNSANFYRNPVILADNQNLYNYSFVSEKIGIKFKLCDFKYLRSHGNGETFSYWGNVFKRTAAPQDPMMSNIHLIGYASGILYNLANVGTTKDFNTPLIGGGAGITFFNGLDFNVSVGLPLIKSQSFQSNYLNAFWSMGFDIQFTEYASRLRANAKKKSEKKELQKLSERQFKLMMN